MNAVVAALRLWRSCVTKRLRNWITSEPKFELQGIWSVYHRHIHAFSFKIVQQQKFTIFI